MRGKILIALGFKGDIFFSLSFFSFHILNLDLTVISISII